MGEVVPFKKPVSADGSGAAKQSEDLPNPETSQRLRHALDAIEHMLEAEPGQERKQQGQHYVGAGRIAVEALDYIESFAGHHPTLSDYSDTAITAQEFCGQHDIQGKADMLYDNNSEAVWRTKPVFFRVLSYAYLEDLTSWIAHTPEG